MNGTVDDIGSKTNLALSNHDEGPQSLMDFFCTILGFTQLSCLSGTYKNEKPIGIKGFELISIVTFVRQKL